MLNLTTIKTTLTNNKWLIIIAGVLFLLVSVWFIKGQIASYEKTLAIAEVQEKALNEKEALLKQSQKDFYTHLKDTQKKNEQIASRQNQIEKDKVKESAESKKQIQGVLTPNKELEEVVKDAKLLLEMEPEVTANKKLAFTVEQVQLLTALKLDYQRLEKELERTQEQLVLEKQISDSLRQELDRSIATLESTNKVMAEVKEVLEAYKKAAKKSRWRVVGDYAKTAATIGISAYVGTKLGN